MKINDYSLTTVKKIKKLWKELPLRDATHDILLFPLEEDFVKGHPRDPFGCGMVECAKRQLHCPLARFMRNEAILAIPNAQDELERVRFIYEGPALRKALEFYDINDGEVPPLPPNGFVLRKPTFSEKTQTKRVYMKRHLRAKARGDSTKRIRRVWKQRKPIWLGSALRYGTGLNKKLEAV